MNDLFKYLPEKIKKNESIKERISKVNEITMTVNRPVILKDAFSDYVLDIVMSKRDIEECMNKLSHNSMYAFQNEISLGYLTLPGGHRAGICGKGIYEKDRIINLSDISTISLRVCREMIGCSNKIFKYLCLSDGSIADTLIVSPPGLGKTTLIRDLARNISDIKKMRVGIADERGEIAACYKGIPQVDIGMRSFVIEGMKKNYSMMYLLRAMSPQVIITDEIGSEEDFKAIRTLLNSGVKVVATAHGYDIKSRFSEYFDRIVVLRDKPGNIGEIIDGRSLKKIYA